MSANPIYNRTYTSYLPVLSSESRLDYGDAQTSVFSNNAQSTCDLEAQFKLVQKEQGALGKAWDGIKNFFHIGLSSDNVKEKIEQYKNGEISYKEVQETIDSFDKKQEGAVNLITNTATGLATAGFAVITGGVGAIAAGAAIGGAAKAGLKTFDRATNEIEGDAIDIKQIAKDGLTGALDGAISTVTAGMIKVPVAGQAVSQAVKIGIIQGAKAGAISGAVIGAGDYTTEAIFEEDVDFTIDDFMAATAQNAVAGGIMGGVMGGITSGFVQNNLNKKVIISHNKNLDAVIDNKKQSRDYLDNFNENNRESAITVSEVYNAKEAELIELSKKSESLARQFDSQIDEAAEQINTVFKDKSDIKFLTARTKGQKSVFSKLAKKNLDGKKLADMKSCYDTVEDALGLRIQMKGLNTGTSKNIVDDILQANNINGTYDDFIKYINGDASFDGTFSGIRGEIIDALKTRQSQGVVDQLTSGIRKGDINITEINNYGDELSSYFTDKQIAEIMDAYQYAVDNNIIKNTKVFEVVNRSPVEYSNVDISADGTTAATSLFKQNTKKAIKQSGYTSTQMNTKHVLQDGTIGNGELQIRGSLVNKFADVEHIPYDIKMGKIFGDDIEKYSGIYGVIKKMSDSDYALYNSYLTDTYKTLRMKELGLLAEDAVMPVLNNYGLSDVITDEMIKLIDVNGLITAGVH